MIPLAQPDNRLGSKTQAETSYTFWFYLIAAVAFIGLADSIYLAVSHYRSYTDLYYQSFCAVSGSVNCDTVSQSPWSILFGVPVPVWGVLGYTAFLFCLLPARTKHSGPLTMWAMLQLIGISFTVISISLALISTYLVRSYCLLCIISYIVNLFLLFATMQVRKRFGKNPFWEDLKSDLTSVLSKPKKALFLFAFFTASAAAATAIPEYWTLVPPAAPTDLRQGVTEDGHPWIGAETPQLEIVEFSDYLCFQCRKIHYYLRQLVARYPDRVRLVHCHFPLDHEHNFIIKEPFHIGSGKLALIAIAAARQKRFWEVNDLFFSRAGLESETSLQAIAESSGMELSTLIKDYESDDVRNQLRLDLWKGLKLRITATPSFVINGTVYTGSIPLEIFKDALGSDVTL